MEDLEGGKEWNDVINLWPQTKKYLKNKEGKG